MERFAHLVCVTKVNNNKFYDMEAHGDKLLVKYGRIGATCTEKEYPIDRWDSIYAQKIGKGYKDETSRAAVKTIVVDDDYYKPIDNPDIATVVEYLRGQARDTIRKNYRVGSDEVTQAMVSAAQSILNYLVGVKDRIDAEAFNDELLELFTVIPRRMGHVDDYLANNRSDFDKIIDREQKLLDVMASQVVDQNMVVSNKNQTKNDETILEAFGLEFTPVTDKDITVIKKELGECAPLYYKAWRVENKKTREKFKGFLKDKGRSFIKKLFWHGSRTENWWSILRTGLVLRPTNVVINGKMFGYGLYFAPKARKSVGYTSLKNSYWAGGTSNFGFLALCEVAYGKPYNVYNSQNDMTWEKLQRVAPGCSSLHAHAGSSLRNDEIIVYREDQVTIKYLVELKAK